MDSKNKAASAAVHLLPVSADEAAVLGAYCRFVYAQHYEYLWLEGGSTWYQNEVYGDAVLAAELRSANVRHFFIVVDGERAGYVRLDLDRGLPGKPGGLELSRLYLSREYTGQGVGQRALEAIAGIARSIGRHYLWLHVMDSSADAIRFYEFTGFEAVGETVLPFERMKPEFRRMLQMHKAL
jgi:ribosomal protein S18 acetylase RimI-like enzyme